MSASAGSTTTNLSSSTHSRLRSLQTPHRDYYAFRMNADVSAGRRHRPCSVLIALQDQSGLKLYDQSGSGFIVELCKGDVLIFAGACPHIGLASRSDEANFKCDLLVLYYYISVLFIILTGFLHILLQRNPVCLGARGAALKQALMT